MYIRSMKTYKENPSLAALHSMVHEIVPARKWGRSKEYIDPETGQEVVMQEVVKDTDKREKIKVIDKLQYTKLYKGLKLSVLNKPALAILDYIREKSVPGSDVISIHVSECMEFCGLDVKNSKVSFYRGLNCLIENEILFKREGSMNDYFLNANLIFNGSRVGVYNKTMKKNKNGNT